MKKLLLFALLFLPVGLVTGQNNCSPVKNNKICYSETQQLSNKMEPAIFEPINKWARDNYGKDIFISNLSSNKSKGTILISSKIELLLNETDSVQVKFKVFIQCRDNEYTVEATDIRYLYDPHKTKKHRTYNAEEVILNGGKDNKIAIITDPELFCDATQFYFNSLFEQIQRAATGRR